MNNRDRNNFFSPKGQELYFSDNKNLTTAEQKEERKRELHRNRQKRYRDKLRQKKLAAENNSEPKDVSERDTTIKISKPEKRRLPAEESLPRKKPRLKGDDLQIIPAEENTAMGLNERLTQHPSNIRNYLEAPPVQPSLYFNDYHQAAPIMMQQPDPQPVNQSSESETDWDKLMKAISNESQPFQSQATAQSNFFQPHQPLREQAPTNFGRFTQTPGNNNAQHNAQHALYPANHFSRTRQLQQQTDPQIIYYLDPKARRIFK